MATTNKDFRIKNGLVVEGSTSTVNGNQVLTTASTNVVKTDTANTFTGGVQQITTASSSTIGLIVKGSSGQTVNIQEWQNSAGTVLASVSSTGGFTVSGITSSSFTTTNGAFLTTDGTNAIIRPFAAAGAIKIRSSSTSVPSLIVFPSAAGATANLQEWQNSSSTILAKIDSAGAATATSFNSITGLSSTNPEALGAVAIGTGTTTARADHVHPTTGLGLTASGLNQFAATTSAQLAGVISDETGSGALVFATSPTLVTPIIGVATGTSLALTGALTATTKSFDIPHPVKEGMRLRYGSLEGPENGVYIRGKSKDKTIELPDYWTGLVHEESITVNLTSIGSGTLYVKEIIGNTVFVGGTSKEFFFTIFAERKDVDKLLVEY